MQTYNIRSLIINMLESFFTSWAFMKAGRMEPGNILVGVIFLLSMFLYRHISIRLTAKPFVYTRATRWTALILSALFSIFYMAVDYPRYIELLTNRLFQAIVLIAVFLGFFYLLLQAASFTVLVQRR